MKIDYQQLPVQTLNNILESYVQREGTEYGEYAYSISEKVAQVQAQLDAGQVVLVFDQETETINILTKDDFRCLSSANDGEL